jgi:hypothetical protein
MWNGAPLDDSPTSRSRPTDPGSKTLAAGARARDRRRLEEGDHIAALHDAEEVLAEHPFASTAGAAVLALYRAAGGRRAPGLPRRAPLLMDEVGIDRSGAAGAQRAILARTQPRPRASRRPPRAHPAAPPAWPWLVAAGAVAVAAVAVVLVATQSSSPGAVAVAPDSVAVIDPAHNRVSSDIPLQSGRGRSRRRRIASGC